MATVTLAETAAVSVALAACVCDLRAGRLPNVLTFPAMIAAVAYHLSVHGWAGGLASLGGLAAGLALFFPFFALGGLGAGDVKLLGALGAWLGAGAILRVALLATLAGGVLATLVMVRHRYAGEAARNVWLLLTHWRVSGVRRLESLTLESATGPRLPYALAITTGLLLAMWLW